MGPSPESITVMASFFKTAALVLEGVGILAAVAGVVYLKLKMYTGVLSSGKKKSDVQTLLTSENRRQDFN